ncbi:hypothetical protein [Pseudomaricurvus sp.]|uniref:hypothetical protein n=1 Tax=Pseudomaricurvus sp. TaxID=2004510 RepID=UPI003F6B264C
MSESYKSRIEGFVDRPDIQQKPGESAQDFRRRAGRMMYGVKNFCQNPELGEPNPTFHAVTGKNVPVYGIDLDGEDSQGSGACAHTDFSGMNGETGVDNQFFRVFGCMKGYQSSGQGNEFGTEMLTGSWGILIKVSGIDDVHNDDSVKVGIYANGDPIRLSPTRDPLDYGTYAIHSAPRFQSETTGKIVDGVLTTEPVEVRFPNITNAMFVDRILEETRLQVNIAEDGKLEGYLAGYSPVENVYDANIGFRNAKAASGEPSPLQRIVGAGFGKAGAMGYTCEGVYHSLYKHADGHPDPETGRCNSISTQYRIQAIPAFVVPPREGAKAE